MKAPDLDDIEHRLSTHEEVCALRYEQINARLKRLEQILLGAAGAIITSAGAIIVLLLNNLIK
jgi:hypothetical protein